LPFCIFLTLISHVITPDRMSSAATAVSSSSAVRSLDDNALESTSSDNSTKAAMALTLTELSEWFPESGIAKMVVDYALLRLSDAAGTVLRTVKNPSYSWCTGSLCHDNGKLYLADGATQSILVLDARTGEQVLQWGSNGTANDQFRYVIGVAVAGEDVYVADIGTDDVKVFNKHNGQFLRKWRHRCTPKGEVFANCNLTVNAGLVYVVDSENYRVNIFRASDGYFVRSFVLSVDGAKQNEEHHYIAVNQGYCVITSLHKRSVSVMDLDGHLLHRWSVDDATGVFTAHGHVWVCITSKKRVDVFLLDGTPVAKWAVTTGQPRGVVVSDGVCWVSLLGPNCTQVLSL